MAINQEALVTEQEEDTQHGRYLTFALGREVYGIKIRFVTEIIGLQPIAEIPHVPAHIKGIINLRGKIVPIIDMRLKFKKKAMEYTDRTCIIVIDTGEVYVGLIVDNVSEVLTIEDGQIVPPPDTGKQNKYISGIGKAGSDVKLLLDCEKLLVEEI